MAYFLGYRAHQFEAFFRFQKNILISFSYRLILDDGSFGYPGAVVVNVSARTESENAAHQFVSTEGDESPDYQVGAHRGYEGFDLRLGCLVTFRGCQKVRQILPDVWQDQVNIKSAKEARLRSSESCPPRIVRNLANNATHIYKLKVLERDKSGKTDNGDSSNEATFSLIEVLKEAVDQRSNTQESNEMHNFQNLPIPFTANSWLRKGQFVILFYENDHYWNSSCAILLADQGNVSTVKDAIPSGSESLRTQQTQVEQH